MDLGVTGWGGVDCIGLAQDRNRWESGNVFLFTNEFPPLILLLVRASARRNCV
jgi:hypothetical protein